MAKYTYIRVTKDIAEWLRSHGKKGETYEMILDRIRQKGITK